MDQKEKVRKEFGNFLKTFNYNPHVLKDSSGNHIQPTDEEVDFFISFFGFFNEGSVGEIMLNYVKAVEENIRMGNDYLKSYLKRGAGHGEYVAHYEEQQIEFIYNFVLATSNKDLCQKFVETAIEQFNVNTRGEFDRIYEQLMGEFPNESTLRNKKA